MDFDEMLETWRSQDKAPIYRVNPDLLAVVVQQEHADLRRESGWDLWFLPLGLWMVASAMLAVAFAWLFMETRGWATPSVWDYAVGGIAIGAMLVWPGAYWLSFRRQPSRERGFGNSLQEEIQRNLSLVDYQLSQYGRLAPSLLMFAPLGVVVAMFVWINARTNDGPFGWLFFISFASSMVFPLIWTVLEFKKRLLAHRRRLSDLLERLNASDWKARE